MVTPLLILAGNPSVWTGPSGNSDGANRSNTVIAYAELAWYAAGAITSS